MEFLPPQSAEPACAVPDAPDEALVPALLSLPQADSVNAAIAAADSVVPNALPKPLSFTYSHFPLRNSDAFRLSGNVCGRGGRPWDGR
jgi:hypothetical protein